MKVDSPELACPSTPPQSAVPKEPSTSEPHSSKVTINLRNADCLQTTSASPGSPTPARLQRDEIKVSVEESEIDMVPAPPTVEATSPSTCTVESPEVPIIPIDDDEDDELEIQGGLTTLMAGFPYRNQGEKYYESIARLIGYFGQQPATFDEVLHHMAIWFDAYLKWVSCETYPANLEHVLQERAFWYAVPELFMSVYQRRGVLAKTSGTRELAGQFFAQLARLSAHFVAIDCHTLERVSRHEELDELELVSPQYLQILGMITRGEDHRAYAGYETMAEITEILRLFQAKMGGSIAKLNRIADLLAKVLMRFPRKTVEYLVGVCSMADNIVHESYQLLTYQTSHQLALQSKKNACLGLTLFQTVSDVLAVVVDKSLNNLSGDAASHLVNTLTRILQHSLLETHKEATDMIKDHRQLHPEVPSHFTSDVIANEWRFRFLGRLMRSRQMQLRVVAVSSMAQDLVQLWKKYSDSNDDDQHMEYLCYFSTFLSEIGLVDYILGPTCHPEITQESFNIIGFLAVTKTYTSAHTDLFWQTVTTTQDPRVAEALCRMMNRTLQLMTPDNVTYVCEKLHNLPIDAFSFHIRELCDSVVKNMVQGRMGLNTVHLAPTPYKLFLRLIQESSIYGPQGIIAHPEIHNFAMSKFKELLSYPVRPGFRPELLHSCLDDIASKSKTTTGSLEAMYAVLRPSLGRELSTLIEEKNFAQLLVDELEHTITIARQVGFLPVYSTTIAYARRDFISYTIMNHGEMLDSTHGRRLWDILVGKGAACQEDRRYAWSTLNTACKRTPLGFDNPFISACLQEYLPNLPPEYYCEGALEFVREALVPIANDANNLVLDDEGSVGNGAIELLWQMVLKAPAQSIESQAIQTLVNDIYVDSKSINSFPVHRARKVHFGLVNRCLQQLAAAAKKLKAFTDGTSSGDDEPMVIVPTDQQQKEEELKFIRSLSVLRTFLKTLQGKSHFAAPDLRSLMLQSPGAVEGESAELKYQSFDGDKQTEVKPLSIGRRNTAASLLASLREATGFDNYRIFYRGAALTPTEDQICKSLEELDIHNGLILVKKESDNVSSLVRVKPGASPLEIEILSHFPELWEYLSMDEKLAREIYQFLVKLPADESILAAFEDPRTSHRDMFPLGQPFKSLYAIHALREYLSTRRLKCQVMRLSTQDTETQQKMASDQEEALIKSMSLLVAAICDPDVVGQCSSEVLQILLSLHLVENFVQLLKEAMDTEWVGQFLTPTLQDCLLEMLSTAAVAPSSQNSLELINRSLEALFECCAKSSQFWEDLKGQSALKQVMQALLLSDERPFVRKNVAKLINSKSSYNYGPSDVLALDFAELFWPMVFELLPRAAMEPHKCEDVFTLSSSLLKKLAESNSPVLNIRQCLVGCGSLLLSHTTVEDVSHPERVDLISHGLISMLHYGIKYLSTRGEPLDLPEDIAQNLFRRHLFPGKEEDGPLVPQVLLHTPSRNMLYEIIFILVKNDPKQYMTLLHDLYDLTPHGMKNDQPVYIYELPQAFDRTKALRSPCGYSGMKNLSNTCYLNSLFTQLFMNLRFRRFILETPIPNADTQQLLSETQVLFSYLQESLRRFVDPVAFVSHITNFDGTPIDTNNQMDVDEFFNLLFDQWEGQLLNENEKKSFKSIYGGQLVQQVKSKECEHVSERMEPFSAIQCDIKGKQSLQESLQAYVDGEVMEGDNKYKCEACDRHVDAVKRACLKDIPDNVIFHLKRFDFSVRSLERRKINDYFAFPSKIDMQPYTVEYLNDPSQTVEPDMFELVGVLVHSGTAESGHYYSFIRERPSTGNVESWVEFNDDVVNSWDPNLMEASCFGGADYRPTFDNGIVEKTYSAYMLFYQRSSSLNKEQALLKQSGRPSPLRVDLPADLEFQLRSDNWCLVQRHNLNDPSHIPFVEKVTTETWGTPECASDHERENMVMQVVLGHLDQVVSRAKDTPDFDAFNQILLHVCGRCPRCSFGFFQYFQDHPEAFRMLLQKNADQTVRHEVGRLFLETLVSIKKHYPKDYGIPTNFAPTRLPVTVMTSVAWLFARLWETFHTSLRAWPDYFGTMAQFAGLGRLEAAALLDHDFLHKTVMIIVADPSMVDLPAQYSRMVNTVSRRMQNRPVSYGHIILLINTLMSFMETEWGVGMDCLEEPDGRHEASFCGELVPYTVYEVNLLHKEWNPRNQSNIFVDKLIRINQNELATNSILGRLMNLSSNMDEGVYRTLRFNVTGQVPSSSYLVTPYLRASALYVRESHNKDNVKRLLVHVANQTRNLQNVEGMGFFDFESAVFDAPRMTELNSRIVRLQSLEMLPRWVPGLLGYMDRAVSSAVEQFLHDKLLQFGPSPEFGDDDGAAELSQAMTVAAKQVAIECLVYLQTTYVARDQQAPKDSVMPLSHIIGQCEPCFDVVNDGLDDPLTVRYKGLCPSVLESLNRLIVDEIEEDGSDWDNSMGSSEQVDSLADLQMQADGDMQ